MPVFPNVLYELLRDLSKLVPNVDLESLAALAGTNTAVAAKIIHHSLSIYRLLKKIPSLSAAKSLTDLVGNTPVLELARYGKATGAAGTLLAKLEFCNPGGSSADRLCAERMAAVQGNGPIVAAASAEEGVSLAWLSACQGRQLFLCMAEDTDPAVQARILLYGAQLTLDLNPPEKAEVLLRTLPGAQALPPYSPSHHAKVHYDATGPELWNAAQGKIDVLVGSAADPDILSGAGQYLKEKNADLNVIAVRLTPDGTNPAQDLVPLSPDGPPLLTVYDDLISVSEPDAWKAVAQLARTEGLLVGPVSGAAAHAAVCLSQRPEFTGKTIAILFPDGAAANFYPHPTVNCPASAR